MPRQDEVWTRMRAASKSAVACAMLLSLAMGCVNRSEFKRADSHEVDAGHTALTITPQQAIADGIDASQIVLTVRGPGCQLLSAVPVTIESDGAANFFTAQTGVTDAQGFFQTQLRTTKAEVKAVKAIVGGVTKSAYATFIPGPPSRAQSTLTAAPPTVVADGVAASAVTFSLRDATGNPVSGFPVSIVSSGSVNVLNPNAGVTDVNGKFATTISSTVSEDKVVTADAGPLQKSVTIAFIAGAASSAQSTLSAAPSRVTADGVSVVNLRLHVEDAFGNAVMGQAVTFSSSGSGVALNPNTGTTNVAGNFDATLASTFAEVKIVSATSGAIVKSANITFVAGAPSASQSQLSISPNTLVADGATAAALQVTLRDAYGNPVSNQNVKLSSTGWSNVINPPLGQTDGTGVFTATMRSTSMGSKVVSADANVALNANVNFTAASLIVQSVVSGLNADSLCALLNSNQAKCWGFNPNGQLGYGDTVNRGRTLATMGSNLPAVNLGGARTARFLSLNDADPTFNGQTCAILDDDTLRCWGGNAYGQLGYGDTIQRSTPSATAIGFPGGNAVVSVTAGVEFTCALLANNQVTCWGYNSDGELGLGDTVTRNQPPSATIDLGPGRYALAIGAGVKSACALLDTHQLTCWGGNAHGELGLGDQSPRNVPSGLSVDVGAGRSVRSFAMGGYFVCALLDNAKVTCWGDNGAGQLGIGDTTARTAPASSVALLNDATRISTGSNKACAVLSDGRAQCWGLNSSGELGVGDALPHTTPGTATVLLGTGRTAIDVAMANYVACALLDNYALKCWGGNYRGELGLGDTIVRGTSVGTMGDALPVTPLW